LFGELKREAEKRVKGYPNLDTMVALVQCPEDYKGVSGSLDEVQGRGEGEGEGEGEAQFCETFWQENKANN